MAKKNNTFEGSLDELEQIVNKMENSKITIDDMLINYEKAAEIIKKLENELNDKKQKFYIVNENMEIKESEV